MASTPTPLLKLEQQASGEHNDTWGDNLNATLAMIENAIAKAAAITTTGGTTTLSDTQFVDNQARCAALDFDGTLVSNATIVVPTRTKSWIVRNDCVGAFTLTVKTSAGTGVVVAQGSVAILWCDGVNVVSVSGDASTLGGFAASAFARLAAHNVWTAGNADTLATLTDGATVTLNVAATNAAKVTLGGDRTLAISNAVNGSWFELYVRQDGTGGRTLAVPANFVSGSTIVLSTAANAVDLLRGRYDSGLDVWYVTLTRGINAGGSSTISDITIEGGNINVDAFALAGQPSAAVSFVFEVEEGAVIASLTPGTPALDFGSFPIGSTITININGIVHAAGGKGGRGAFAGDVESANIFGDGTAGTAGGDAIRLPSAACTIAINIGTNGRVWGGGGGGGGGGASHDGDGSNVGTAGGGGGGGAGAGIPGDGGSIVAANGAPGEPGGVGRLGVGGTGGAGADTGGTGTGSAGGAGGTFGVAGTAGTTAPAETYNGAAGAGGAAGKAINYNGGSTPSYTGNTGSPYILGATS